MLPIIQETIKKINRQIDKTSLLSFSVTIILLIIFTFYINSQIKGDNTPVNYIENSNINTIIKTNKTNIWASVNGITYTYSWCSGANNIKEVNRIYFASDEEAINSGKRLSKLCNK